MIQRNFNRTEHDDFALKVSPLLNEFNEAVPVYCDNGILIGWLI